jgi:hypothetical protein
MRVVARFGFAIANPVTRSPNATPFPFSVMGIPGGPAPVAAESEEPTTTRTTRGTKS